MKVRLSNQIRKNKNLEKEKHEIEIMLMRRIKELEKKVNKEKKKSNAVLSGFQGYLSSRHLKKVPMGLESPDTSFEGVSLKKKKSRKNKKKEK